MSIQAISWAMAQDIAPASAKLLLIVIANYSNEHGQSWPSKKRLAKDCSLSKAAMCKQLVHLKELGYVAVQERFEEGAQLSSIITLTGGLAGDTPCHTDAQSVVSPTRLPLSHTPDTEPSIEPSIETYTAQALSVRGVLEGVLSPGRARDIIEHRIAMKAKLTVRAAELLATELAKTQNPDEAADHIIQKGWRGFKASWYNERGDDYADIDDKETARAILRGESVEGQLCPSGQGLRERQ